ncbi:MAG: hypothetical protein NTW60_00915 [Candidatus Wolfebacteria bacterium]|nr:hypothetical protein [Candidatus Wolfebacteria bacterium]
MKKLKIEKIKFWSLIFIGIILMWSLFNYSLSKAAITSQDIKNEASNFGSDSPIKSVQDITSVIEGLVRWVYYIFFVAAVYFLLAAAFGYLAGGSNPEAVKKAHKSLLWAFVAIAVALISVGAANIVRDFITPVGGS